MTDSTQSERGIDPTTTELVTSDEVLSAKTLLLTNSRLKRNNTEYPEAINTMARLLAAFTKGTQDVYRYYRDERKLSLPQLPETELDDGRINKIAQLVIPSSEVNSHAFFRVFIQSLENYRYKDIHKIIATYRIVDDKKILLFEGSLEDCLYFAGIEEADHFVYLVNNPGLSNEEILPSSETPPAIYDAQPHEYHALQTQWYFAKQRYGVDSPQAKSFEKRRQEAEKVSSQKHAHDQ